MNKTYQIALVDDDKLVVQLLKDYLHELDFINVCLTANSGNAFIELLKQHEIPELVIMDLKMDDGTGLETMDYLAKHYPDLKIIVLSSYYKPGFLGHLLKSGGDAFLSKETDKEELAFIVKEVMEKGHYFSSEQVAILRQQVSNKTAPAQVYGKEKLSERELEVLSLICAQYTAKEIAERLFISVKTVEVHKSNLLLKTASKNTAGLIIYAAQQRLINPDEFTVLD